MKLIYLMMTTLTCIYQNTDYTYAIYNLFLDLSYYYIKIEKLVKWHIYIYIYITRVKVAYIINVVLRFLFIEGNI
jgi:hypothetical protein